VKVDVAQLLKNLGREDKVEESYNYKFDGEENVNLVSPVKYNLKIVGLNEGVLVTGKAITEVELNCARCGKKYIQSLEIEMEEEYKLPHLVVSKKDLFDEDTVFEIEDEKYIDLTEAVRQGILVNLPLQSVCSKECGLCKKIGENKKNDPRFSKLSELKNKIEK